MPRQEVGAGDTGCGYGSSVRRREYPHEAWPKPLRQLGTQVMRSPGPGGGIEFRCRTAGGDRAVAAADRDAVRGRRGNVAGVVHRDVRGVPDRLIVVDTATYWSGYGQGGAIVALIQIGGFGIMTMASLIGLVLANRIGLRARLNAAAEVRTSGLGDVRAVIVGGGTHQRAHRNRRGDSVGRTVRDRIRRTLPRAVWLGVFHAVSAFNNAGFALYSDNIIGFADDPWICVPLLVAVVLGGIGFPVLFEVGRHLRGRSRRWSLHTRMTVTVTAVLLVLGPLLVLALEWRHTLSGHALGGRNC